MSSAVEGIFIVIGIVIVIAIIGCLINISRFNNLSTSAPALQQALAGNVGSALVYYNFGNANNVRVQPDSSNVSGSVLGVLTAAGNFEVIVHFATPLSSTPKAVMLTAGTPMSGTPLSGLVLTVDNITNLGFEVIGYTPSASADGVLFYYMVL